MRKMILERAALMPIPGSMRAIAYYIKFHKFTMKIKYKNVHSIDTLGSAIDYTAFICNTFLTSKFPSLDICYTFGVFLCNFFFSFLLLKYIFPPFNYFRFLIRIKAVNQFSGLMGHFTYVYTLEEFDNRK